MAAAYELNPSYNQWDYANMKTYKANWNKAIAPGGNLGRIGTAISHLAELQDIVWELKDQWQSNLQIKNAIINRAKVRLGRPGITSFNQAAAAVSSELAGAYKGNASPSESDREERWNTIGIELSPAQFDAWIKTAGNLLFGKTSTDVGLCIYLYLYRIYLLLVLMVGIVLLLVSLLILGISDLVLGMLWIYLLS